MTITRRGFLRTGVVSGITAVVPLASSNAFGQKGSGASAGAANSPFVNSDLLNFINASVFEDYLNTSFSVRTDALHTQKLELVRVRLIEYSPKLQGFSLQFASPSGANFPQATYLFEHEKMGTFPLFIVPIKTPKGIRYEAIFNRLRASGVKSSK